MRDHAVDAGRNRSRAKIQRALCSDVLVRTMSGSRGRKRFLLVGEMGKAYVLAECRPPAPTDIVAKVIHKTALSLQFFL